MFIDTLQTAVVGIIGAASALLGTWLSNNHSYKIQQHAQEHATAEKKREHALARLEEAIGLIEEIQIWVRTLTPYSVSVIAMKQGSDLSAELPVVSWPRMAMIISAYAPDLQVQLSEIENLYRKIGQEVVQVVVANSSKEQGGSIASLAMQSEELDKKLNVLLKAIPKLMHDKNLI